MFNKKNQTIMEELKSSIKEELSNCKNNVEIIGLIERTENIARLHIISEHLWSEDKQLARLAASKITYIANLKDAYVSSKS